MNRIVGAVGALLLVFGLFVPAAAATDPAVSPDGRVVVSTGGPIDVAAGDHLDALIVVNGSATIEGDVDAIVAVQSTVTLTGATAGSILAVRAPITLAGGTEVSGDIARFDSSVQQLGVVRIGGGIRDIAVDVAGLGFVLGPIAILLYLGFALAAIAGGLFLAALAARQVRAAEALISKEPGQTLLAAIVGVFAPVLLIGALFVTVVGAPLALALLIGVWPLAALVGYLVAGIWLGDWLLRRMSAVERERPYLAAVVGLLILEVVGIWPFVPMIASLFGYGAVVLLAWRTFRGPGIEGVARMSSAPSAA